MNGEMHTNGERSSVFEELLEKSVKWQIPIDSEEFAERMDKEDPLKEFRKLFYYPKKKDIAGVHLIDQSDENEECIYFCGHSLGLQLKSMEPKVKATLNNWALRGVECHFKGDFSAVFSDQISKEKMAALVGAETSEIAFMNGLTVNIHLMLATFYNPTPNRNKILMIDGGFHSDWYALQSHVTLRGYDPEKSIIFIKPRQGKHIIDQDDIFKVIEEDGENIALVYIEGVHYYTGQLFDLKEIAKVAHQQGCVVGYDLAHAAGNVKLQLHDWNVDFAIWCTYKYLNSGPGNIGAIFCHNKHTKSANQIMPQLRGWWGLDIKRKFAFDKEFTPAVGADRFALSNPPPILSALVSSSVDVFYEAGMDRIQEKQRLITGYLEYLLEEKVLSSIQNNGKPSIQIITPQNPKERGSQISLLSTIPISTCEKLLKEQGIIVRIN